MVSVGGPKLLIKHGGIVNMNKRKSRKSEVASREVSFKSPGVAPAYAAQKSAMKTAYSYTLHCWNSTILMVWVVNEPDEHGVIKYWVTPLPDNAISAYTIYYLHAYTYFAIIRRF